MIPIPDAVDDAQAVLARLGAISCHGLRTTPHWPTDRVAVLGLGAIGLFSAKFHTCFGRTIVGFDRSADRVAMARAWGIEADHVTGSTAEHLRRRFPEGADVIVDATGVPAVLADAVDALREPAWGVPCDPPVRYVVQGSYRDELPLPYWPLFNREAQIFLPRDWEPGDLRAIFDLIEAGQLDFPEALYTVADPAEADAVYDAFERRSAAGVTALFPLGGQTGGLSGNARSALCPCADWRWDAARDPAFRVRRLVCARMASSRHFSSIFPCRQRTSLYNLDVKILSSKKRGTHRLPRTF